MIVTLIILLSNFQTIDLLSKIVFGTFSFGQNTMLGMSWSQLFYGRDELVYNLEFTHINTLYHKVLQDIRLGKNDVVFVHRDIDWGHFYAPIDTVSYKRTFSNSDSFSPFTTYYDIKDNRNSSKLSGRIYFISYPFIRNKEKELHALLKLLKEKNMPCAIESFKTYTDDGGYEVYVWKLRKI